MTAVKLHIKGDTRLKVKDLPDGTFFEVDGSIYLKPGAGEYHGEPVYGLNLGDPADWIDDGDKLVRRIHSITITEG